MYIVSNQTIFRYRNIIPNNNIISNFDIIIISDYNKGAVRRDTVAKALGKGAKVLVDPKQSPSYYTGAFLVKPKVPINEFAPRPKAPRAAAPAAIPTLPGS